MDNNDTLSNNGLAFIALSNEYCSAVENIANMETSEAVNAMLRLLPRIYIAASDIPEDLLGGEGGYIPVAIDEPTYDRYRQTLAAVFGEDDTFLEVFMDDMKYSDTPIAATISESLADIYQALFDFLEACRDAPNSLINESLQAVRDSFAEYWSQTLVNVLRPLNKLKY